MCDSKILCVYKIVVRDWKSYVVVSEAKSEIRDCKPLRVCKTTVPVCNFYVDVTQPSCELRDYDFTCL